MRLLTATIALALVSTAASAQQLTYTPINPSFGGNSFNSSHLLGLAGAQNQFKPGSGYEEQTQAQQFARQLQSSILGGVAQQISDAIFGENPAQGGSISFGGTKVDFTRTLEGVTINVTDPLGVATQIVVPTFQPAQ